MRGYQGLGLGLLEGADRLERTNRRTIKDLENMSSQERLKYLSLICKTVAEQDLVNHQNCKRFALKMIIIYCLLYPSRKGQKVGREIR